MAYDEQMADRFRDALLKFGVNNVDEKKMFGALGFMIDGKLTVCVGSEDAMYKLGTTRSKELIDEGVAEPVVMGKRIMKDWVNIYFYNSDEQDAFDQYLLQSLEYTQNNF